MLYRRGDVVLLELPFSDRTGKKKRPALVIANETYLAATSDVIVCAVASQPRAGAFPGATQVRFWRDAGLLAPSVIKATIHTVDRVLIDRRLGTLHPEDLSEVDRSLRAVLF